MDEVYDVFFSPYSLETSTIFFLERHERDRHAEWLPLDTGLDTKDGFTFVEEADIP
jgi:hypothetical protein